MNLRRPRVYSRHFHNSAAYALHFAHMLLLYAIDEYFRALIPLRR